MKDRVSVTNPAPAGGAALLAQVFYADPVGHVDSAPIESRMIHPGITAILALGEDHHLVISRAPELAPARASAGRAFRDGEA